MLRTIKAKFTDGVLVPLEPVEFKEGVKSCSALTTRTTSHPRNGAKYPWPLLAAGLVTLTWTS